MVGKIIKRTYMGLIFLFLYMPILVLIVFSFNESKSRGHWGGFTLKWYGELFRDPDITKALYYTFLVAFLSSLIATVIGTISAIGIHNMGLLEKGYPECELPAVLNPDIVTGVALMTLFISMNMRRLHDNAYIPRSIQYSVCHSVGSSQASADEPTYG